MTNLTPEGLRLVSDVANRHGFSVDAALALIGSLLQGNGYQAQFNHPEFGGMGQWSQGGMIMIGDMFNQGLKHRVDALCNEFAALLRGDPSLVAADRAFQSQSQSGAGVSMFVAGSGAGGQWWPAELGAPASVGAQNDLRYAFFPAARRLAILQGGRLRLYDAGAHQLSGFSQQQGGDQSLTFTSQFGLVRVAELPEVSQPGAPAQPPSQAAPAPAAAPEIRSPPAPAAAAVAATAPAAADEILKTLERLGELRKKDILTEEEFAAKKAELLGRL